MERIDEPPPAHLSINDLPEEILEFIFSFLNIKERIKIERVCKKWQYIGTSFQWKIKELNRNIVSTDLTDYILKEILKRCGNSVLSIDIADCSELTAKALSIIGDHCPNLKSIQVEGISTTDSELIYFSSKCSKLKEAVLWNFGEEGLRRFFKSFQELEVLHLRNMYLDITGLCFQFINPKLKKLTLDSCGALTTEGFLKLGKCKCLEHLELSNCWDINRSVIFNDYRHLDTASLEEVLKQNCNSLKHFGLRGSFSQKIIYQALPFKLLTKLESISFKENHSIKDDTLLKIVNNCKNLRTLDVSDTDVTDFGLKQLTSCPLLATLNVSYVNKITDESIIPLAMVGKLESFTIQGNENITDNACNTLSIHCIKLKYLDLSGCRKITDETVISFLNTMKLRKDKQQKLKIFGGGTMINGYTEMDELTVAHENLCPNNRRRW